MSNIDKSWLFFFKVIFFKVGRIEFCTIKVLRMREKSSEERRKADMGWFLMKDIINLILIIMKRGMKMRLIIWIHLLKICKLIYLQN